LEVLVVLRWFIGLLLVCILLPAVSMGDDNFMVLSYHDVRDDVIDDLDPDRVAVGTKNLIVQFSWLREHGYHPVSLDEILAAKAGTAQLPEKAVLLTFDDGFTSMYTRVFPLLKRFGYPAVIALVGSWVDAGPDEKIPYGDQVVSRNRFLTWDQIREMVDSGLIEVAAHSYDLHRAVAANPQGNVQPVIVTRRYDQSAGQYEDLQSHRRLIRNDMRQITSLIKERIGVSPRCMVWPYGLDNRAAWEEARAAGMEITMVLGDCINNVGDLSRICRLLIEENPPLRDFVWLFRNYHRIRDPIRVVHVDLDYVHDTNKDQQKRNLDILLDRIKEMKINTVYLQAFSDPDGDGAAEALYFPNRHMPMRADLFNRVAWQLRTRAEVDVYAWMPVLAFELDDKQLAEKLLVRRWEAGNVIPSDDWYRRLSPFHSKARSIIGEIYEDLAANAFFTGLLFHDDAYLSDFEDAGAQAMKAYGGWGLPEDIEAIRQDQAFFRRWSRLKTEALAEFTDELTERVRRFRPDVITARNIYARAVLDPRAEKWLAQSMETFLRHYDFTAIMAMPYLEKAEKPRQWLDSLVKTVAAHEDGLKKSVFELQSVRWDPDEKLKTPLLNGQMKRLQRQGAVNFGYYPDDFISNHPQIEKIRPAISLQTYPYKK
jgi:biofilm PGA synthesis lipoprotein PgaB